MKSHGFILDFLKGSSWAFALVGSYIVFKSFLIFGLSSALFLTFLFIFVALFLIAAVDAFIINKERDEELKKQTKILQDILYELQSEKEN
ncbi:hypothetical protein MNB_SM-7-240 [hydrothermal vent metagenome]|uniref:Uncharacterized protein n=1 Tax=hydrothermal vent metagenome TaxID=652676 RepID=A0A1W1BBL0_9ZZZZ